MATSADYLVNQTVADAAQLIRELAAARTTIARMVQRARGVGLTTVDAYANWPAGYTVAEFKALFNLALDPLDPANALPESIVPNTLRGRLHKLVANIQ